MKDITVSPPPERTMRCSMWPRPSWPLSVKPTSTHGGVVGAFGREFAKTAKLDAKFHRWLIDGQDIRNVGDYEVGVEISKEQAMELIAHAEAFVGAGRDHLQSEGVTEDEGR